MVKLHNIPHQLSQIHVCRRSWRNRIPSLEDYYASLCIVHVKEYKCTLSPLFLGSTVCSKGALGHHTCTCSLGIEYTYMYTCTVWRVACACTCSCWLDNELFSGVIIFVVFFNSSHWVHLCAGPAVCYQGGGYWPVWPHQVERGNHWTTRHSLWRWDFNLFKGVAPNCCLYMYFTCYCQ